MTNISHKNPHYALRIEETTMDKLKYIAGHNGRSANKEIEQLILAHIGRILSIFARTSARKTYAKK